MKLRSNMKIKLTCAALAAFVTAAFASVGAAAETSVNITLRIEGIDSNIYYEKLSVSDSDDDITAADALIFADKKSDTIEIKGADSGYITEINSVSAGKFGGYDGWYYCVNDNAPDVGVKDYKLKDGDELTVYYGGFPCQIPFAETEKLESDGIITFKSNDMIYDENYNATPVVAAVKDADVTVNGEKYKTDEKGEIKLDTEKLNGDLSVQISAVNESGAPRVLRFEPGYTIAYKATETDTDSGTDTETDTDSSSSSSESSSNSSSSSSSESSSSSSNSNTSSRSNSTNNNTTNTVTQYSAQTTTTVSQVVTEQTGDGRTYRALAVFAGAAILVVFLVIMGKVINKDKE